MDHGKSGGSGAGAPASGRWRVEGCVLMAPDDPRSHGTFTVDIAYCDDPMTAMRFAASEIERKDLTTRGRPFLFTLVKSLGEQ